MAMKTKLFLVSLLIFSTVTLSLSYRLDFDQQQGRDPQQHCQQQCQQEQRPDQQRRCEQHCQEKMREQQEQEQQEQQHQYERCQQQCEEQQQSTQQQRRCEQSCQEEKKRQQKEQQQQQQQQQPQQQQQQRCTQQCQQEQSPDQQRHCDQRCQQPQQEEQSQQGEQGRSREEQQNNPYFFDRQSFVERFRNQEGSVRMLQRFSQQSSLLRGIDNYRLTIFEANPNTFVVPSHFDAEAIFYIVKGNGVISLLQEENKESYNLQRGDILRVRAGTTVYLINRDNSEKLYIAALFQPVGMPSQYEAFSGAGGEAPESYYRAFSNNVLQAAFNTPREKLEKLFGRQRKGAIVRASQEQIRALSQHASEGGRRAPWGGSQSSGPYNLLNKRPFHSNNLGQMYKVDANEYKQLKDLDVYVSFTKINQGAMSAPFYNSRATTVVLVVEGRGRFEMACPHLSKQSQSEHGRRGQEGQEQEQEEQGGQGSRGQQQQGQEQEQEHGQGQRQEQGRQQGDVHYQRVSAHLSPQTVFVIPAGHPTTVIADNNENLQLVAFDINAQNNKRNYLAGKNNILNQLEREAKELSFNMPAKEVDSIINNQDNQYFLPGPNQRQQREGGSELILESIFEFAGF